MNKRLLQKASILSVLAAGIALFSIGCSRSQDTSSALIGRWDGGGAGLEFFENSVLNIWKEHGDRFSVAGTYSLVDPQHLKIEANNRSEMMTLGSISNDQLLLNGEGYQRIESSAVGIYDVPYRFNSGLGRVEENRSNGEADAHDGKIITLNGQTYFIGLGTHAPSTITVKLNGECSTFLSDIGIDDEVGDKGSVIFEVWADGEKLYESGEMTGASPTKTVNVSVEGKQELRLVVNSNGDNQFDHADWAKARMIVKSLPPMTN